MDKDYMKQGLLCAALIMAQIRGDEKAAAELDAALTALNATVSERLNSGVSA